MNELWETIKQSLIPANLKWASMSGSATQDIIALKLKTKELEERIRVVEQRLIIQSRSPNGSLSQGGPIDPRSPYLAEEEGREKAGAD